MRKKYKVGDHYTFGKYMQGAEDDEKTPIEWEILDARDGMVTMISRYILDIYDPVNECVEDWLGEFTEAAFSQDELRQVAQSASLPSIDDIRKYYSDRTYPLMSYWTRGWNKNIGAFGKALIATGTGHALKRGLTVKVYDRDTYFRKLWVENKYLDAYYSNSHEGFEYSTRANADEIFGLQASAWLLWGDCFVGFDTTADEEISLDEAEDMKDCVPGIRPIITICPDDQDSFGFKYTNAFFADLANGFLSRGKKIKLKEPAADDEILSCMEELEARLKENHIAYDGDFPDVMLPDDYISFLKITNGFTYSPTCLFGVPKGSERYDGNNYFLKDLLSANEEPLNAFLIGQKEYYDDDDKNEYKFYYNPYSKKYYVRYYCWPQGEITEFYSFEDFYRYIFKFVISVGDLPG